LEGVGLGDREAAVLAEGIAANSSITVLDLQVVPVQRDSFPSGVREHIACTLACARVACVP
jgi:hypothetical protein